MARVSGFPTRNVIMAAGLIEVVSYVVFTAEQQPSPWDYFYFYISMYPGKNLDVIA